MKGPWPFQRYEVTYIDFCGKVLIEETDLRLEYWHSISEIKELAIAFGFFKPLYRFALSLIPVEALNAEIDYVSEVLAQLSDKDKTGSVAPDYPYMLSKVLDRHSSRRDSGG